MDAIRTTCAYCGVGCGISAKLTGPRQVQIAGDRDHPANRGALCSKGTHLGETVALEGRLLHPMIGDRRVDWDGALDELAGRLRETIEQHGPDSVAFYLSGQLLTEDYYVANKLMKGFIGSGNIDTNSRLCMASAVAAHNRTFGEDVVPCSYEDLDRADLVLLLGSNTAWCHPIAWQRIEQARMRRGTKIVVIDPRRTETAEQADLHVALAPDGDVALLNALLAELERRGKLDERFLEQRCDLSDGFRDGLACDPGVPEGIFRKLADLAAANPRMVTLFSQGAKQSVCGTDKCTAILNLHLATGRINRPGAGPLSITGQPNAMGGREVGGLATTLACHLGFSPEERADAARFWNAPNLCSGPGLKAVDMFRAMHEGKIRFLWVMGTNPAVSMPDVGFVREALARCPTLVVSDIMADTDTARFAHIRLPALGWGEKDGTVTNSERLVSRQRRVLPPPGEARADWRIIADVAARLGHGPAFAFRKPADIFREYAAMTGLAASRGKLLDLTAWAQCSDREYARMEPFQWGGTHPLVRRFPTPNGKARLVAVSPAKLKGEPDFPLRLNTGRYRDQWHTMSRTGLSPRLSLHRREPLLDIHPADATRFMLPEGGLARVTTPFGSAIYRVAIRESQRRGEVFVPIHWTDVMGSMGRTGRLAQSEVDLTSGQPGFKNTPARVEAVEPEWRGFLAARDPIAPDVAYWSRSRVEHGWLIEMAGMGAVDCDQLLPGGTRAEALDSTRGMRRIAVYDDHGRLNAALYVTRSGVLPSREWISGQLASKNAGVPEWLAARPSTPLPDRGPTICVCHDVGEQEVLASIDAGALDIAAIGACTKAGTNCGSCRPLLTKLLAETRAPFEEAAQ